MAKKDHPADEQEVKISTSRIDMEHVFNTLSRRIRDKDILHKYRPRDYYDTADFDLHNAKMSLRLQYLEGKGRLSGGFEQTLKFEIDQGKTQADALLRRECKDMVFAHEPALDKISDPSGAEKVSTLKDKPLNHIFTAAVERRYFNMTIGKGKHKAIVEIAFDVGEVILPTDQSRHPFSEIEIELKKGDPAAIGTVQKQIMELAPTAHVEHQSKAEQGVNLYLKSLKR